MSLPYLIDNPSQLKIISEAKVCGFISVNILPINENGKNLVEIMEDEGRVIEEPQEILDKEIHFKMIIEKAEINEDFWQNTYCEYQLIEDNKL